MITRRHFVTSTGIAAIDLCNSLPVRAGSAVTKPALVIRARDWLRDASRVDFQGSSGAEIEETQFGSMLRVIPRNSATGFYFKIDPAFASARTVRWLWQVTRIHKSADLRHLEREDSAATVMFSFGTPSIWNRDVPTIAYCWTSTIVGRETALGSKRYASLKYIQLQGREAVGEVKIEQRDLKSDFRMLFNREAPALENVAIFNDNDQTRESVIAKFGDISIE